MTIRTRTNQARSLRNYRTCTLSGRYVATEQLKDSIGSFPDSRKLPFLASDSTFRISVETFGKALTFDEQRERINSLTYIPFEPILQRRIFFGREVGFADRKLLPAFQLKSRTYLGPTAMDAEMAFLMANQAKATSGKLVYDPFVGTGSILVSAARFGAMTMGADIDIRVVRDGRGPDCNVWSNFKQYGLPMPVALLRMDNNLPPWRSGLNEIFDAIICDPPYGVRAGGRKSGGRKILRGTVDPYTVPEDKRTDHIPSTGAYSLVECVHDLLHLAARMLVMKGRLVFFFPVLRDENGSEVKFPEHPCFKLVAVSEQILSSRYSRVLLTMVKVEPYSQEVEEAARLMHLEFRENHLKWLEEGNIHSSVFKPSDHSQIRADTKSFKDPKPKYRGKYV
uniref:tRNA (guanine(10)-N(2))-methyltransferase n=1 Tax=Brassica oleracea var. oleracea TaxID=109376 RepID=A0A0D3AW16_BRAOL